MRKGMLETGESNTSPLYNFHKIIAVRATDLLLLVTLT